MHEATMVHCRMCGHQWAAVYQIGTDYGNLECPQCSHKTGEPVDLLDQSDDD